MCKLKCVWIYVITKFIEAEYGCDCELKKIQTIRKGNLSMMEQTLMVKIILIILVVIVNPTAVPSSSDDDDNDEHRQLVESV